jgi:hypothetical protein
MSLVKINLLIEDYFFRLKRNVEKNYCQLIFKFFFFILIISETTVSPNFFFAFLIFLKELERGVLNGEFL